MTPPDARDLLQHEAVEVFIILCLSTKRRVLGYYEVRRIADFYAGLVGDFRNTQRWKRLRRTKHDHHPVHDALGNAEALIRLFEGER